MLPDGLSRKVTPIMYVWHLLSTYSRSQNCVFSDIGLALFCAKLVENHTYVLWYLCLVATVQVWATQCSFILKLSVSLLHSVGVVNCKIPKTVTTIWYSCFLQAMTAARSWCRSFTARNSGKWNTPGSLWTVVAFVSILLDYRPFSYEWRAFSLLRFIGRIHPLIHHLKAHFSI